MKYREILQTLESAIQSGEFGEDGRLPSDTALSRRWKVSRPTVARAVQSLQLRGVVTRRVGSGTFVNARYRPSQFVLGLLVDGLGGTAILDPICAEVTRYFQERGCGVFTGVMAHGRTPAQLAAHWVECGVNGVLFAPFEDMKNRAEINAAVARAFAKAGLPVVLLDRDIVEFPDRSELDLVTLDNFLAGLDLANHLIASGARSIALVARSGYAATTVDLRLAGIAEALRRAGAKPPELFAGDPKDGDFISHILSRAPWEALVASNDHNAAEMVTTLGQLDHRVPTDLMVAGFDDAPLARLISPALTTIRQPCRAIARACVQMLLERIEHPDLPSRTVLLGGELVARASTRARRQTASFSRKPSSAASTPCRTSR